MLPGWVAFQKHNPDQVSPLFTALKLLSTILVKIQPPWQNRLFGLCPPHLWPLSRTSLYWTWTKSHLIFPLKLSLPPTQPMGGWLKTTHPSRCILVILYSGKISSLLSSIQATNHQCTLHVSGMTFISWIAMFLFICPFHLISEPL